MKTTIRILLALALFAAFQAEARTFYKWVDDRGTIHFTAEPPADRDYEVVDTRGGKLSSIPMRTPAPAEEEDDAGDEAEPTMPREAEPDPEQLAARCRQAEENLFWLQERRRIRVERDDGTEEFLEPEERQRQIDETRAFLDEWCRDG
ncbi:MAG: DUF4124 domain-containing protein [Wenzhouxiangellaceae bacterium]|nr:DUF4124 domain-containing protein [Wenzhouxiangellaceae bacterium]